MTRRYRWSAFFILAAACYMGQPWAQATGSIPLDKRYADLTPEEKKLVLSNYGNLGPGDEPPYPADGLAPVVRQVSELEKKRMAYGPADMLVRVDARGEPTSVAVLRAEASPEIKQALAFVLMHTRYKPARCKGNPCEGDYLFTYDFKGR